MKKTLQAQSLNVQSYTLKDQSDAEALGLIWRPLFSQSTSSFFLSWRWINPFITLALEAGYLLHVIQASTPVGEVVGLAIFCERKQRRHKIFKYKQLYLHKTGDEKLDKSWIEYNDFLIHHRLERSAKQAMWRYVISHFKNIDEFIVGVSEEQKLLDIEKMNKGLIRWDYANTAGWILHSEKGEQTNYASKQATSQIKRSNKLLASQGFVTTISDLETDFLTALTEIAPIHKETWSDESGFHFETFTRYLTMLCQQSDETTLISAKLKNDTHTVAIIIGFIVRDTFYYYLSANKTSPTNKVKYGLSLHHNLITWCAEKGINNYDFLAGDYRYKRSFANKRIDFRYAFFQRPSLKARAEQWLRSIKKRLFSKE